MTIGGALSLGSTIADVAKREKNYNNTKFQIEHNKAKSTVVSANDPANAQFLEQFPRLVIYYPTLMHGFNSSIYGKTVGFACNIQNRIGDFSGFTVFSGADLSGLTCQEEIKQRLYSSLQQGIIL